LSFIPGIISQLVAFMWINHFSIKGIDQWSMVLSADFNPTDEIVVLKSKPRCNLHCVVLYDHVIVLLCVKTNEA
jgi:hypothetical protein